MIELLESSVVIKMSVAECSDLNRVLGELRVGDFTDDDGDQNILGELWNVILKGLGEDE